MDILYGRNPVLEALRAGRGVRKLVVAEGVKPEARLEEILQFASRQGIAVETSPRRRLDDITHTEHHQGVAGYFHSRAEMSLEELLAAARPPAMLLCLDGIQDPQNLGALARTAEAVGVDGLVMPRHRAAPVTAAAVKASAGATEHLPLVTVPNLAQALEHIADAGLLRVGLAGEGKQRYDEVDFTQPVAIVVGAEGSGMRELTRKRCDTLVHLPMVGRVSSLNAGAAAAAILYEAFRQRGFVRR